MNETLQKATRVSGLFIKKNAPIILTSIGAVGVVATAVSTAKGATKASKLLDQAKEAKGEELTTGERIKVAAPSFIPAVLFGTATITCIFGANVLNKRKQASLIGAYTMLDSTFKQYKDKLKELYGDDADKKIVDEIAKENHPGVVPQKELFYDSFSQRYFESTMEDVLKAENETNKMMVTGWAVGVNEFYEQLGLKGIVEYNELGWSYNMMADMYWHEWIEFDHRKVEADDGSVYTVIDMPLPPFAGYLDEY